MQEVYITQLPDLLLTFDGQKVTLPAAIRKKVDQHWKELVNNNPRLHNGEVFTVINIQKSGGRTVISLAETDYAHYLYSYQVGGLGEYTVHIIHPSALVVSEDRKYIFGSMGEHTSRPGVIQCCGGGLDHADVKDGVVEVGHSVAKELSEELGIDVEDASRVASCRPAYLKGGGTRGILTIVYVLQLKESARDFLHAYEKFVRELEARGEEPEFDELFSIPASVESVEAFISQYKDRLGEAIAVTLRQALNDLA